MQSRCLLSISSVDKIKLKGTFRNNGNIVTVKCVEETSAVVHFISSSARIEALPTDPVSD